MAQQTHNPAIVQICLDQFARGKPLYDWLKSL